MKVRSTENPVLRHELYNIVEGIDDKYESPIYRKPMKTLKTCTLVDYSSP